MRNFAIISHRYTILQKVGNFILKKTKVQHLQNLVLLDPHIHNVVEIIAYIEEEEETREKPRLMHKQTKTSHANCCKACW
jgi:hypothetical protein